MELYLEKKVQMEKKAQASAWGQETCGMDREIGRAGAR